MIIDNVHILHLIGLISIYRENTVKYLTTTSSTWFKAEFTNKEKENLLMKLQQVNTFLHFLSLLISVLPIISIAKLKFQQSIRFCYIINKFTKELKKGNSNKMAICSQYHCNPFGTSVCIHSVHDEAHLNKCTNLVCRC